MYMYYMYVYIYIYMCVKSEMGLSATQRVAALRNAELPPPQGFKLLLPLPASMVAYKYIYIYIYICR